MLPLVWSDEAQSDLLIVPTQERGNDQNCRPSQLHRDLSGSRQPDSHPACATCAAAIPLAVRRQIRLDKLPDIIYHLPPMLQVFRGRFARRMKREAGALREAISPALPPQR